jgi:hypothetical protein
MRRLAVLIACQNVPGEAPLSGAVADVQRFERFLLSPYGGAWRPSEIMKLVDPRVRDVAAALLASSLADYTLFTFSGHGWYLVDDETGEGETMLCMASPRDIPETALISQCPRQLVIIDACRTVFRPEPQVKIGGLAEVFKSMPDAAASRRLFDDLVPRCEAGRIVMYSCGLDESAGEDKYGGYFSRALVDECEAACTGSHQQVIVNALNGFQRAEQAMTARHPPQHPEYNGGRRHHHFPLAVAAY